MGELDQTRTDEPIETPPKEPKRGFWASFGRTARAQAQPGQDETREVSGKLVPTTQVGRLLQEARESRLISLEEAENVTRIRSKYLAALESGAYGELPTSGHVHGFLRNYAIFLGLDWQEVEALYRKENPTRHFDPGIFHPENIDLAPRRPLLRAELVLILVVIVVVVVIGGWAVWQYGLPLLYPAKSTPTQTVATATVAQKVVGVGTPTATATRQTSVAPTVTKTLRTVTPTSEPPTPTLVRPTATATHNTPLIATPTISPTQTPSSTLVSANGVSLTIKVIERAWIQVTIDGQEQPGKIFEANEERSWEAQKTIYFICGNAGGVEITVNGNALGLLGRRAEVVEKIWTPQGEATPTPRPAATPTPTPAS